MNNKSNFWKQVTYVMKTIMEHINISYDGANKSVQIRIVSTEEGMQEDYNRGRAVSITGVR